MHCGIYHILNTVTGDQYIGSSVDIFRRLTQHRGLLNRGKHHSSFLQSAWKKYGESAFIFEKLWSVEAEKECLYYEEQLALNNIQCHYNMTPCVTGPGGYMSEATKMKISASKTGISVNKGIPKSVEHRQKIGLAQKGKPKSPEQIQKYLKSRNPTYVHFIKSRNKWAAVHYVGGKLRRIGCFLTEEEALDAVSKFREQ